jgi:hypothetical protein
MFQMENLKSIDKKRNRKRGSYHLFLNYIKDNGITTKYDFDRNKDNYIQTIASSFPEANLIEQLGALLLKEKKDAYIAEKFNGDLIMLWLPNLQGKELGAAISKFKADLGDRFEEFVFYSDSQTIRNHFMNVYNEQSK